MARALVLLREQEFAGVYVDTAQLSAVRWAGVLIQADEILDAIADGVAVVDPDLRIIWANPEFHSLADPAVAADRQQVLPGAGQPRGPRPRPLPVHHGGRLAGAGEHGAADRRRTATSGSPSRPSSTAAASSPT